MVQDLIKTVVAGTNVKLKILLDNNWIELAGQTNCNILKEVSCLDITTKECLGKQKQVPMKEKWQINVFGQYILNDKTINYIEAALSGFEEIDITISVGDAFSYVGKAVIKEMPLKEEVGELKYALVLLSSSDLKKTESK